MNTTPRISKLKANPAQTVVGTWDIEVTLRDCATGTCISTLRVVDVFSVDGVLIETGAETTSGFGGTRHGTWQHKSGNSFVAVLQFYRTERDGSIADILRTTRHLEVTRDASQFTATARIEAFDSNNRLTLTQCATEVAVRLG